MLFSSDASASSIVVWFISIALVISLNEMFWSWVLYTISQISESVNGKKTSLLPVLLYVCENKMKMTSATTMCCGLTFGLGETFVGSKMGTL